MKKIHGILLYCLISTLWLPVAHAQIKQEKVKTDSLVELLSKHNKFMGTIAFMENGKLAYSNAAGFADFENKIKASNKTTYRIGSVSKTFTTAMIFQLVEEKKISLDEKLSAYFPQIVNSEKISIKELLLHRSGLWSITDDSLYLQWCTQPKSRDELLGMINSHPVLFSPGEKSEYSNSNFLLLGYIIEDITKKSYAINLQERIVNKAGLTSTYYGKPADIQNNESYSYLYTGEGWKKDIETDMSIPGGAGAIVSTSEDLVKFAHALFSGQLISKESLDEMLSTEGTYAKGIFPMPFYELKGFGHTGGIDGFRSVLIYFPEKEMALAITSNGLNYNQNELLIGILSIQTGREYKLPDFSTVKVDIKKLQSYEGTYSSEGFPIKLTVKLEGEILTAQGTGQSAFPLEAVSETEFRYDAAGIKISFPEDGKLNIKQGGLDLLMSRE
jgi:CubicO group peptidase (beta-lactamase class C family)